MYAILCMYIKQYTCVQTFSYILVINCINVFKMQRDT